MALILEFTIPSEAFPFGRAVSGGKDGSVALERLIPLDESRIPFLWVDKSDYGEFEERLRASDIVKQVEALTLSSTRVSASTCLTISLALSCASNSS